MLFRKADSRDLERLIEIRQQFQRLFHHTDGGDALAESLRAYFLRHMADGGSVVWLAEEKGRIVSCAFLTCYEDLPSAENPLGRKGYLHNVYTVPAFRGKGLATQVVKRCIQSARDWGAGSVSLGATQEGAAVYRNLGFEFSDLEMELKL